jgi:hypothetical protein
LLPNATIVSSNLQRAIETITLALSDRLSQRSVKKEKNTFYSRLYAVESITLAFETIMLAFETITLALSDPPKATILKSTPYGGFTLLIY